MAVRVGYQRIQRKRPRPEFQKITTLYPEARENHLGVGSEDQGQGVVLPPVHVELRVNLFA